jgi:hypothetical protein
MGASTQTTAPRFLAADEFAKLPFNPDVIKYNPTNIHMIDPTKNYPKSYQEFMTSDGYWDLYGNFHGAVEEWTTIDEAEVKKIVDKRQEKLDDKRAKDLKKLEDKMQMELEQRFKERKILDHEVDTTNIDDMFAIYSNLGGLGQDSMQREL